MSNCLYISVGSDSRLFSVILRDEAKKNLSILGGVYLVLVERLRVTLYVSR